MKATQTLPPGPCLFILAFLLVGSPAPSIFAMDLGRATVQPDRATIREEGNWTVHHTVGPMGIAVGGGIRIQFPNAWFADPWGVKKAPQTTDPEAPHSVYGKASRAETTLDITIGMEGVDGQHDRYERAFDVVVRSAPLVQGDVVSITFGNTRAPNVSETDTIGVAVDPGGNRRFIPLPEFPEFTVHSGKPQRLLVLIPSQGIPRSEIPVRIVALDEWNNRAASFLGDAELTVSGSENPQTVVFQSEDRGLRVVPITIDESGSYTVQVRSPQFPDSPFFESNPIVVFDGIPDRQLFWGDIHSHSETSKDALGRPETAFENARDVFGLDFYSLTDHSVGDQKALGEWWEGILPSEWDLTLRLVREFYEPGRFVTILGYEWSSPAPYGDHNIYFRGDSEYFFDLQNHRSIDELWSILEPRNAITVPHHTGISWRGINSPYVDWSLQKNDRMQPAVELYSLHGSSEYFNNEMRYENYDFSPATSNFGPYYARDGWAAGHYLASIASSDNHTAHPGQPFGGVTCVLAEALTRDAIFDAILQRRTYATTGARIVLHFEINNQMMGSQFSPSIEEPLDITVEVLGTDVLEYVEVMRFADGQWSTSYRWVPDDNTRTASIQYSEPRRETDSVYYCRVRQKNQYFNRDVMAWSTPIWILASPVENR